MAAIINDTAKQIDALKASGLELFPLLPRSKRPRDTGWLINDYSGFDAKQHVKAGGNIGARLKQGQAVLDFDPRNGGDLGLYALELDLGDALARAPVMETGGGGWHYYFDTPDDVRLVGKLRGYPGIDVKTFGGFVVVAGVHPETGKSYRAQRGFGRPLPRASDALLKRLVRPVPPKGTRGEHGVASPDELAVLLGALDPCDYGAGHHDRFVQMMAACHDASAGEGKEEFLAWAAGDPDYGDAASEQNAYRWDSFTSGKPGGATYKTLLKAVADAGRRDLVAQFDSTDPSDDFEDDEDEPNAGLVKRPVIKIVDAELPSILRQAEEALRASDAGIYQTNGRLAHLYRYNNADDEEGDDEPIKRPDQTLLMGVVEALPLRVILTEVADWRKFDGRSEKWKPVAAPLSYAAHLLAGPEWKSLRVLRGAIEAPTLRQDGTILQEPGYDRRTNLYFDPTA